MTSKLKGLLRTATAVLLIAVLLSTAMVCTALAENPVTLTICLPGNAMANLKDWYAELDKVTIPAINAILRVVQLPAGGDRNSQYNLSLTTGEYDMYYSGSWVNHSDYARKHAFADITDLVKEVTPALYAALPEADWEGSKVDGRLYCIPQTTRDYSTVACYFYRKDLCDKYNLDPIDSFEDIGDYLRAVTKEEGMGGIADSPVSKWAFAQNLDLVAIDAQEFMTGIGKYGVLTTKSSGCTDIVSLFDEPAYVSALKTMKSWYDEGLVNRDILSGQLKTNDMLFAGTNAGIGAGDARTYWSDAYRIENQKLDIELAIYEYGSNNYKSRSGQSSVAISAKSKNINTCLKFMELCHTNQEFYNLMSYGIDGVNYRLTEDNCMDTSGIPQEYIFAFWRFWGNENLELKSADRWSGYDEYVKAHIEAEANVDPMNGFIFNTSEISDLVAACEQVYNQYQAPLINGISNDVEADLAKLRERYTRAGLDKIIEAARVQLKAFAEAKAK